MAVVGVSAYAACDCGCKKCCPVNSSAKCEKTVTNNCTCAKCDSAKAKIDSCQCDKCTSKKDCTCSKCEKAKTQLENCKCPQC